jgi:hypothetical protein
MVWFFRDFLNFAACVAVVYLFYSNFIPSKPKTFEDYMDDFKRMRLGLGYICLGILALRGIVWVFDRFYHTS